MTNNKIALIVVCMTATALALVLPPQLTRGQGNTPQNAKLCPLALFPQYDMPCDTPVSTQIILSDLIRCESQGKETAINAVDRDGTPSYGLLQFKPSTLLGVIKGSNLIPDFEDGEISNVMLFGNLQIRAFLAMYGDGKPRSWWRQQFPDCSRKNGYWGIIE